VKADRQSVNQKIELKDKRSNPKECCSWGYTRYGFLATEAGKALAFSTFPPNAYLMTSHAKTLLGS